MKKIITSLFIFVFSFMFINNVNAITITESTDPTDGFTTIQDNSIVIGVTRFEDGVVITAQRAATAGVNDALFNIGVDGYSGVNIYYYLGGSWFVLDDENQANPLDESNLEDKETIEELESPEIYYVNNVEKQLTVDFTFDGEGNLEFNTDNNKDGLVSYADGKLTIPATVKNLQIEIKDPATGDVLGLVVLTKDPVNNTDYETTSLTNYINALGRVVEADYTEASWTTYQSVVLANVVTKNNTQEEVDTATSNITTAQGSLVFAGKTALDAAKAVAGGLTESTYTIATWSVLTTALELPETTNALILTKTTAITTAISNLVVKADLTAYNAALAAVVEADYTEASWATYQGVVSSNLVTVESTQGAVNTATANITTAQGSLITKLTQAKSDAKEELTTALGTYTGSDYTEGNWTILNGYKTTGDTAIENATTVGEVSTAKTTALEAMDGVLTNAEILAEAKADAIAAIGVNYLVGTPRILTQAEISAIGITVGADQKLFEVMITPDYENLETAQLSGRAVNTVFTVATPNITVYYPHWNGTTNVLKSGDSTGSGGPYIVGMAAYPLSYPNLENPAPFYVLVNDTIDADVSITIKLEDSEWNDVLYANQTVVKDYNELLLMIAKYEAKEELTTALGTYTGSDYTEGNWTILNGYKTTGDTAIENATTVGEVSTAKTTALEAMDGVLTNAEIEANAILYAQNNSTLTGDLIAGITATFPVIVPSYFEAGLYKINSEILLNGDVDGVITITKNGTPLVITGGLAAGTYTFTQLAKIASGLADEPIPANFVPSTYNGHVENYTVSVSSNLVPINTTISIRSIISKDNFVTNIELSKLENLSLILGYEDEGIVVSGQIVADGEGKVNGSLDFLGKDDLIIVGNVTGVGNITTFSGTVTGRINGNITAGLNANGIDTLSGLITDVSGATQPIRIIGTFIQSGIPGDFIGEIIVGPIPTYVESMTIKSEGDINTLSVGNTLQLGVDIIPSGASNNVAWSVYVNDTGMGSISKTGLFTATAQGKVTIIAKALDGSLKDDTFDITINP